MEQQQTQQSIGQAAINMVATERYQQRQKVLAWMLAQGKLPMLNGVLSFKPGDKIGQSATLADLQKEFDRTLRGVEEILNPLTNALHAIANDKSLDMVSIAGGVHGYIDHPDTDSRIEVQLWTDGSQTIAPNAILTFALRMASERGRSFWVWSGFKPYREEWPNMLMDIPTEEPKDQFPRVDPEKIAAVPALGEIFMSRDQRLGIKPAATQQADMGLANLASFGTLTGEVQEDDGKMSLFGPGPQRLAEIAAGNREQFTMAEKIARLFSRGHRMSDADLAVGGKMKLDIRRREDAKHFLDEVFRNGNLWMYNQLNTALEANERNLDLVFELSVNGNWQEYRGPIEAEIKMKAYWTKDPVRVHKVFSISGPMELGYHWPASK